MDIFATFATLQGLKATKSFIKINFNHYVFKDRKMLEFECNPCETLDFKHNLVFHLHNDSCKLGLSII